MQRGEKITKYVEREIINHSHLVHPHIVQFKEVFLTTDYLAIAMEYAAGGDMFQHVKQKRGLQEVEVSTCTAHMAVSMLVVPYFKEMLASELLKPLQQP